MPKTAKVAIGIVIVVVAIAGILVYARPDGSMPATAQPIPEHALTADTTLHDFGTISMKDGNVATTFTVQNTTEQPVPLKKLYTSCMCTSASLKINGGTKGPYGMLGHGIIPTFTETLQPGQEAQIEVVFDPNAHGPSGVGPIDRFVALEGPDDAVLVQVEIKANVTP